MNLRVIRDGRRFSGLACTLQCPGSKLQSGDWLSAASLADRVTRYGVVTVHIDGSVDINNASHIASQLAKLIAFISHSHKGDQ